jgi:hypothetical protein
MDAGWRRWYALPDQTGRFRVAGEEGDFTLRAETEDGAWVSEAVRAQPWPGGTDPRELVLALVPAFAVHGRVLDARGPAVPGVDIDVERDAPTPTNYVWTRTDEAGRFAAALPAGVYELRASSGDGVHAGVLRLELSSDRPPPPALELRLAPRPADQ